MSDTHQRSEGYRARVGPLDSVVDAPDGRMLRVDRDGRWLTARLDGGLYRRVMDGTVVVQTRRDRPPRDVAAPDAVHAEVSAMARVVAGDLGQGSIPVALTGRDARREALIAHLSRAAARGPASWREEQARYLAAYDEAVEILPPDRYRDVVVLPATGCPNSTCTFCAFYRGRGLSVKPPAAFAAHLEAVRGLFGEALGLRRGLFLGSASALSLGQPKLLAAMAAARDVLGDFPRGMAAFWDPDHAPRRTPAQWEALVDAGLRRAYVGLETGLSTLRAQVGKSGDLTRLGGRLREAAAAGVGIGVIVLAGLGGADVAEAHRRATTGLVAALGLDARDVVYVSGLEGPVSGAALDAEVAALHDDLMAATSAKVAPYAMQAFRYYAG